MATLEQFFTENPVVSRNVTGMVAQLMNVSKTKSRNLIEQGAVDVERNQTIFTIGLGEFVLKNDVIRVGKGKTFRIV